MEREILITLNDNRVTFPCDRPNRARLLSTDAGTGAEQPGRSCQTESPFVAS